MINLVQLLLVTCVRALNMTLVRLYNSVFQVIYNESQRQIKKFLSNKDYRYAPVFFILCTPCMGAEERPKQGNQ